MQISFLTFFNLASEHSHTHSHTRTHTYTHSHTHTHTHTHIHTQKHSHTFSCRYTLPLLTLNFPKQYFFSHSKNNIQRSSCNILIFILCLQAFAATYKHLMEKNKQMRSKMNDLKKVILMSLSKMKVLN